MSDATTLISPARVSLARAAFIVPTINSAHNAPENRIKSRPLSQIPESPRLQPSKLLDCLLNRFQFLNVGVHGMFFEIELLCRSQHFGSLLSRHDHHSVAVGGDDVSRIYGHAITHKTFLSIEPVMMHRGRRHNSGPVNRKSYLGQIRYVAHATIDHSACVIARHHSRAHQAAHAGNVSAVFDRHDVYRVRGP